MHSGLTQPGRQPSGPRARSPDEGELGRGQTPAGTGVGVGVGGEGGTGWALPAWTGGHRATAQLQLRLGPLTPAWQLARPSRSRAGRWRRCGGMRPVEAPCTPWPSTQSPRQPARGAVSWLAAPRTRFRTSPPALVPEEPPPSAQQQGRSRAPRYASPHPPQGHTGPRPGLLPPAKAPGCHLEMCSRLVLRWVRHTRDHSWPRGGHRVGRSGGEELRAWP